MIYIHSYGVGKFGSKQIRNIHDTLEEAKAQQRVLGGVVQTFESVENIESEWIEREHIKEIVVDEVACLIDDLTTDEPGSPRNYEPGSTQWDCWKVKTLGNIRDIMDGKFNEIE
ncbi:hypothetical protein FDI94_gp37 [Salmonella phage FSL SP-126]|uniref:Uncharacterized protein n=1 Tax=Salmonella phage FSL SP-126 TaxID=2928681 RepID=S4TSZ2_9CAUD|nr:hypothetical protein FDI94_gp37 [Salmonella phage FSL SP-126]AGF87867.1 hypothetical protein SP126_00185 [Salmonella phage FSL SP-126]